LSGGLEQKRTKPCVCGENATSERKASMSDAHGLEARVERLENHIRALGVDVLTPEQAAEKDKADKKAASDAAKAEKEAAAEAAA
jgi:hypothetical protein